MAHPEMGADKIYDRTQTEREEGRKEDRQAKGSFAPLQEGTPFMGGGKDDRPHLQRRRPYLASLTAVQLQGTGNGGEELLLWTGFNYCT